MKGLFVVFLMKKIEGYINIKTPVGCFYIPTSLFLNKPSETKNSYFLNK